MKAVNAEAKLTKRALLMDKPVESKTAKSPKEYLINKVSRFYLNQFTKFMRYFMAKYCN